MTHRTAESGRGDVAGSLDEAERTSAPKTAGPPDSRDLRRAANLLKSLADPARLRACVLLSQQGPMNVGALADACGASSSAMSHQLRVLRNLGLVDYRRNGKTTVYELTSRSARRLVDCALDAVGGSAG